MLVIILLKHEKARKVFLLYSASEFCLHPEWDKARSIQHFLFLPSFYSPNTYSHLLLLGKYGFLFLCYTVPAIHISREALFQRNRWSTAKILHQVLLKNKDCSASIIPLYPWKCFFVFPIEGTLFPISGFLFPGVSKMYFMVHFVSSSTRCILCNDRLIEFHWSIARWKK